MLLIGAVKPIADTGAVSEFGSGGGVRDGERSEPKYFGTPLSNFTRGCQLLFYKHINRGLTYDLLIVIYHLLKIFACIFYQNIAHIHFNFI